MVNTRASLGRALYEHGIMQFRQFLSFFYRNSTLMIDISLVTDDNLDSIVCRIGIELLKPNAELVKCFAICNVIDEDYALSSSIIR